MPTKTSRSTSRRRKPDEPADAEDVTFTEFGEDAIDFDDEPPKKKKTTRKKAAKKASAKKTTKKAAKKTAKKAAKKTTKSSRGKVARKSDDDTASDEEVSFGESVEEEAPAARPRKTAAKKTRSRRTTKKSDDEAIDDDAIAFEEADDSADDKDSMKTATKATKSTSARRGTKKTRSRKAADEDARDDDTQSELFDEDDDPKPRTRSRRSRSTGDDTSGDSNRDERPTSRSQSRSRDRDDEKDVESFDSDDSSSEDTATESRSSRSRRGRSSRNGESRNDSSDDGDQQPRRRRRRRGRRGKGGNDDQGGRPQSSNRRSRRGRGSRSNQPRGGGQPTVTKDYSDASGPCDGVLELHPTKGYGFLRDKSNDYIPQEADPFVSVQQIERYCLREGVFITGEIGPGHRNQGPRLQEIETVEGIPADDFCEVQPFDKLTPVNPTEQIKLEVGPSPITMRVMDLLAPIGKGQRALIVAPPRSGKTILLQQIADSVAHNHPECHLMVVLIDERPEEVTEMRRHVKGDVIASSMDRDLENHVRVSQLVIERAKRLAERGEDVFILLDSITRTARAFNKYTNSGRTGSGGIDVRAMDVPKKLFGTARLFDEGGSVTVVGTALIETGGRMDDVIFQEFKGTGNMELVLSRDLADRRIFPAIDISRTGTRREELLLDPETLDGINMMRRSLLSLHPVEAMETLIRALAKFDTNAEFLSKVKAML